MRQQFPEQGEFAYEIQYMQKPRKIGNKLFIFVYRLYNKIRVKTFLLFTIVYQMYISLKKSGTTELVGTAYG